MNCGGCDENCTGDVRCHQCGEPICPDVRGPGPGGEHFCSRECEEEWRAEMRAEEPDEECEPLPAASCGGTTQQQQEQPRRKESNEKTESDANVSLPRRASPAGDSVSAVEPLAAIVREMRDLGKLDEKSTDQIPRSLMGLGLRTYADRIEAAVKRDIRIERTEAIDEALAHAEEVRAEKCRNCTERERAPSNEAAMRHALEKCAELGDQIDNWLGSDEATVWNCRNERSAAHNIMLTARAALAAPPHKGRWMNGRSYEYEYAYCSECGRMQWAGWDTHKQAEENIESFADDYRFCPGCGAEMEGGAYVK